MRAAACARKLVARNQNAGALRWLEPDIDGAVDHVGSIDDPEAVTVNLYSDDTLLLSVRAGLE